MSVCLCLGFFLSLSLSSLCLSFLESLSLWLLVCPRVMYLSVYQFIKLCLPVHVSASYVCVRLSLSGWLSLTIYKSLSISVCLCLFQSICLCLSLSVCLSISLPVCFVAVELHFIHPGDYCIGIGFLISKLHVCTGRHMFLVMILGHAFGFGLRYN